MGTRIKFCGINTTDALDAAIGAAADYIGLVFYEKSPRHVDLMTAAQLAARSSGRVRHVGLFVDADEDLILSAIRAGQLDALQLHGTENPETATRLRRQTGLPIWKAISIGTAEDVEAATRWSGLADLILLDAKTPKGTLPGGMGVKFDWSLLDRFQSASPWGLAGGLTPDNIADALARTRAPLVDTSSGIESAPGIKDMDKIAAFAYAVRQYDKA